MKPVHGRIDRLRSAIEHAGLDGMLVTGLMNVRWASGYTGSNAAICVTADDVRLLTDFRYKTAVEPLRELLAVEIVDQGLVADLVSRLGTIFGRGTKVGFESHLLPHADWHALDEAASASGIELEPKVRLVEDLRAIKTPDEIDLIRRAAGLADDVLSSIVDEGLAGQSERDLAWRFAQRLREVGSAPAFDTIVAFGEHGALAHAETRDVEVERSSMVVIDYGALFGGYCSDCTRTFATGPTTDRMKEVYEVVLRAQETCLEMVRPGTPCIDVHETARRIIGEAGYGDYFNHGTGHGVGIDIHEEPRFRSGYGGVLQPGNVVTIEPGVYLPGEFGVRIEDLVAVTDDGYECFTRLPKSLLDVG